VSGTGHFSPVCRVKSALFGRTIKHGRGELQTPHALTVFPSCHFQGVERYAIIGTVASDYSSPGGFTRYTSLVGS